MKAVLIVIMALVAGLFGYFYFGLPSYSWHQKMTIEVEADGKVYSGSSVVRVRWRKNDPLGASNGPAWIKSVKGEAAFVEIPGRGVLFALLDTPYNLSNAQNIAFKILGMGVWNLPMQERYAALQQKLSKPITVPKTLYPTLVTFAKLNNPKSVRPVDPMDLSASFGSGISLKSITLELTNEMANSGLLEKSGFMRAFRNQSTLSGLQAFDPHYKDPVYYLTVKSFRLGE